MAPSQKWGISREIHEILRDFAQSLGGFGDLKGFYPENLVRDFV
jgi:hypothetical protein